MVSADKASFTVQGLPDSCI